MELLYDVFYNRLRENFIKMNETSCNSRNSSSRSSSNNSTNCYNNYLLQYENYNNSFNIYLNNDYGNELIDIVSVDRDHHHHDRDSNNNNKIVVNKNNNNEPMDDSDDNNSSDEKAQISLWQPWKLSNSHITKTTKDPKLTSKELPTTKWRRDRRQRTSPEYHHQSSQSSQLQQPSQPTTPTSLPFANCLRLSNSANDVDLAPLDMSLTMKPRSPPPPYRAPLPGSIYASCVSNSINGNNITNSGSNTNLNHSSSSSSSDSVSPRPSVITQAPKRDAKGVKCEKESISMCDPVIDEHFRRSLGDNYMILFSQNGQSNKKQKPNELDDARPSIENSKIKTELSSDDDDEDDDDQEDDLEEEVNNDIEEDDEIDVQHDEHNKDDDVGNMMDTQSNTSSSSSLSNSNRNTNNSSPKAVDLVKTANLSPKTLNNNNNSSNNSINSNNSNKQQQSTTTTTTISSDSIELSVDDHFAKALGETWKKLQESNSSNKKDTLRPCVN